MKKFLQHRKGVFALLLALFLGMGTAYAYDFSEVYSGKTFYFNITDATHHYVELTYPGTLTEPWGGHVQPTGNVTLPSTISHDGTNYTVTGIGEYAFFRCDGLTGSLTIPNTVTEIGEFAFQVCDGFTGSLNLGNSVTTIGNYAFMQCGFTGSLTLPNTLTSIGEIAFAYCEGFTGSLNIPNSVTSIGEAAFVGCTGFNGTLTIGTGLTSMGASAFKNCSSFTHVNYNAVNCANVTSAAKPFENCSGTLTIGNTVQRIPSYMFNDADGLVGSLTIPNSVTDIGYCAFQACDGFTGSLTIGNSVTTIETGTFGWCPNFSGTLTIGSSVTTIEEFAFYEDSSFTGSLTIPNSVTTIGDYAFSGCGFTGSLTLGISLTSIGYMAFHSCNGFTGSLTIPDSVTTIEDWAFYNCNGFTGSLTISNSVTTIGDMTFSSCSGFTGSLTIPNAVTSIGFQAFSSCGGFTNLYIGTSVTTIEDSAFNYCTGLTSIMLYPETPPTLGTAFNNVPRNIPVRVPCGKVSAYQNASGWNEFTNMTAYCDPLTYSINPDGVSVTVTGHVDGTNATGELFIPETKLIDGVSYTVTAIANFAFSECSGLTGNLVIPNTVTSIGRYAFQACTGFTGTLTLSDNLTTLDQGAFYLCSGFTGTLNLPNTLAVIPKDAFAGCTGFTGTLTIPNTVTSIGDLAFHTCAGLTGSLTIPNTVTTIGKQAFCNCSGLDGTLTIGTGVTSIGESAFKNCNNLTHVNYNAVNCADVISTDKPFENCTGTITIGNTVQRIPAYLFFEAKGLTGSLTIPNSVTTIGSCAFAGCEGFTGSLTIGNSVTTIEFGGFGWCPNFTTLTLGSSLSYIGSQAFYVDTGLTGTLTIPNSVTYIGSCAFDSCHFTGSLTIPNSVTYIDYSAFLDCTGFSGTLTIGASLTEIGSGAFYNCTGFTQVNYNAINCVGVAPYTNGSYSSPFVSCGGTLNIGSNVQRIPAYMFKDCTGFTGSLVIPNSVTEVGANAFDNCTGFTGSLILGNSLTTIGDFAFYGMHFTGNLTIPDSVTTMGQYAFAWCGYFTGSLTIGNSLTTIPVCAFYQCNNFTSLTISSSVTTIEGYAFSRCSSLTSMTVRPEAPPTFGVEAFELVPKNIPVYVPCSSIGDYQAANGWSTFTNYQCIPWTVTLSVNPSDGGTVSGEGTYANGASCTVTATPNDDYLFMHWRSNGEVVSCNASYTFTVTQDVELEAVFMPLDNEGTIIGSGENTNVYLPSYSLYNYCLSQQIYTAIELGGSFTINSISFFNAGNEETRRYDVYLVHTSKSSFSSNTDWIPVYQADCVYTGLVTMRKGMWTTIVLDTPFNYNGTSNLALIMDDNTGDFTYSPHMACRVYNAPQSNQAMRIYSDGTNYAANNPSSYTGTRMSVKNQIMFNRPVYTITATPNNASMGTVTGGGQYGYGDLCRLEATANSGHTFLDWMRNDGVAVTDEAEYEFIVTGDRTLRANFFEGTDVCNLTLNLGSYDYNWGGNYLEVHFGNGMSHLFGVLNGEPTSYTLPFVNGSHVELNMQIGSFTDQYHFEVRYANGNLICTSDVLVGESSYEFDVDCDEMHPELVYIGDGDNITNTYLPSYSYYKYGLSQQIYTAAEIGSGGNITSIAFYNQGENNTKTRTYDIYLKPTSKLMFVNEHDWIGVSEADKVFSGSVTMVPGKWTFINFDAPFVYDGTSNIVLVMDDNTGDYTNEPHMACRVFDANGDQTIRAFSDDINYNPSNPSTYTGALVTVKNQLYFGFTQSLGCWPPMHLSSTDVTSNSATFNWTGYQDSYNVRYRSVPSFYEDFEDEETFGDNWTFTSMNAINDIGGTGSNPAGIYTSAKHSGLYGFRFSSFSRKTEDETYDQYLISPQLTVTGELKFYFRKTNNSEENFYVGYSTTGKNITNFTWSEDLVPTQSWQEYTLQLPSNVKYIAFHYFGNFTYCVYLDDITIGESGVSVGNWNTMNNVAGTITEITGLDPTSNYEWQVQGNDANCNDNGVTQWSKKATFTTRCEALLVDADNPFFEDFESGTFAPGCWENIPSFDGSYYWGSSTYRSHSSSHSAYSGYYGDIYLVMPQIELTSNASEATLSFWSFNNFINDFEVGNNTVVLLDGDDETLLWSAETVASEWVETSIDLTPYLGQTITLAFKYAGNNGNAWYLDDVEVSVAPPTTVTQTIELAEGWNWFSLSIEADPTTALQMLEEALGVHAEQIKARNGQYAEYDDEEEEWFGNLAGLTSENMYMINIITPCTIELQGPPANPANHPISIVPGWNWIGFPSAVSMSVANAFADFEAEEDDELKGRGPYTIFDGDEWFGGLTTLQPGQGYMYYSNSSETKTLVFPSGAK
ncbi:MAG: leucine-rich repeat protein [Bacteroidales bacterium]|nr:leucine-rich repeat protein [Bacteroidales bacterium]